MSRPIARTEPPLSGFHPIVRDWFAASFPAATEAQAAAWPVIAQGAHTLLLAPTGSGKTLAAFLVAIDRLMFAPPAAMVGPRVLYVSPLKALGVDVERNLRAPLDGIAAAAQRRGVAFRLPRVGVRTGDTPPRERHRLLSAPPDILITTPESLYLLLTSRAREILRGVDTVIVDEIHSLVAGKRGAHLFVSLERLEALRREGRPRAQAAQRIGLSATQRPLAEVARLLGGADAAEPPRPRPVEVIDAGGRKALALTVEVPVEDMARPAEGGASDSAPPSIWPSIHPRLVELIRAHRSTMIFVNSRRLAERLAGAINDLAGEELALAHHGSVAKDTRAAIEDRLKRGVLPAIVATSSLELGIDMGAVDLVIQIEAPPSVAAGIQRVGRSGHQVGAVSSGIIFPKYRGDLLAAAAAAERMHAGAVEASYYPRNPLDVLAQQLVAMVALGPVAADALYTVVRCAAPFAELPRAAFDSVLDLLSGRYPSDEFAELRARVTWDRVEGVVHPRQGAQRTAVLNAGTIPDRGLYGVYLIDRTGEGARRVGELDEEMVFETRPGEVFLLGASSWRVVDITHDRVLVTPAPGEPGKMPFWRGDGPGRPLEFGRAIGALTRALTSLPPAAARARLIAQHALEPRAADNLLRYLREQAAATGEVPSDITIVVESFVDEVGDWRVAVMTPFGARVHAPWAAAVAARLRERTPGEVDLLWSDDGMVFRLPESDAPPPPEALFPTAEEVEDLVVRELSHTALFAARFRENAGRALLLPKRFPGRRTPLWLQRRRAADLLAVASRYPDFPIVLETYRECLRDVFDLPGLVGLLRDVERRAIRVHALRTRAPSPFAASLLFGYVANFIYNGDAPLAERRAQALALDYGKLRELLGDAELRELLDPDAVARLARALQRTDGARPVAHADGVHDLLLALGDLTADELDARCDPAAVARGEPARWIERLRAQRRIIEVPLGGQQRLAAAEDAARLRDAFGVQPPEGLPAAFLEPVARPLEDIVSRYARTHVPFTAAAVAARYAIGVAPVEAALERLAREDRVLEGEFLPGGHGREWCDAQVLRRLKRDSLARLRKQIEPVEPQAYARFLPRWHGVTRPRRGLDALLDVIEQLQGVPLPASALESQILPARLRDYQLGDIDRLCGAGEVVWQGRERIGARDGRIALYLSDAMPALAAIPAPVAGELAGRIRDLLAQRGALFFEDIAAALGGFPPDLYKALWDLVWGGEVSNDTLAPVRALRRPPGSGRGHGGRRAGYRTRRTRSTVGIAGRWSLLTGPNRGFAPPTERAAALAAQLLERYGIVTRELVTQEGVAGGFAGLYPVYKAMEEAGRVRRGYFVAGMGAAQFALPGADDRLREAGTVAETVVLAATDPANAYGAALRWPDTTAGPPRPQRAAGARVVLRDGALVAYVGRTGRSLLTFLPEAGAERDAAMHDLVAALIAGGEPLLIERIDGRPPTESPLAVALRAAGCRPTNRGFLRRPGDA